MILNNIKISSFLTERKVKLKPGDANDSGLKRIVKIDFSGRILLSDTQTQTDMILIKKGNLVISGINVEKGAMAVYEGDEDILASIHYSAYEYDSTIIDIGYLKWYLKSDAFKNILIEQTSSGIKTEIKAKQLLQLVIKLPLIPDQQKVVKYIETFSNNNRLLCNEIQKQCRYITKLRQSILQLAVKGKLCEQNPSDDPASELLKKIKVEKDKLIDKGKVKKRKSLPPITNDDQPFALPKKWKWCRLGEITELITSGSRDWSKYYSNTGAKFIRMGNLSRDSFKLRTNNIQYVSLPQKVEGNRTRLEMNDILLSITGEVGLLGLIPPDFGEAYINQHTALIRFSKLLNTTYCAFTLLSPLCQRQFSAPQRGIKNSFRLSDIEYILFPLPPIDEQELIVSKLNKYMVYCDELEKQVNKSKINAEKLIQSILMKSFCAECKDNTAAEVLIITPKTQTSPIKLAARGDISEKTMRHIEQAINDMCGDL